MAFAYSLGMRIAKRRSLNKARVAVARKLAAMRRTKATLIYRKTVNLRAVQQLLGHSKIESTVRYLGIEVDDALLIAEQVDI